MVGDKLLVNDEHRLMTMTHDTISSQINKQITINNIKESYHSWIGHMRTSNSSTAIGRIDKIYNRLFQGEILKWQ